MKISAADVSQFRKDGFMIIPDALSVDDLTLLRRVCDYHLRESAFRAAPEGHPKPIFINNLSWMDPSMRPYLFGSLAAEICRATIGENAYFSWEQFVVKTPARGGVFNWHQDGGYLGYPHPAYINMWCALDDVNEENGTLYLLPQSEAGGGELIPHVVDEKSQDKIGYRGSARGVPVIGPAGTLAVFSSLTFHSSSVNQTDRVRRSFSAQYAPEPLMNREGTAIRYIAIPLLRDGEQVSPEDKWFESEPQ